MDFVCPNCGAQYRISDSLLPLKERGARSIACKECSVVVDRDQVNPKPLAPIARASFGDSFVPVSRRRGDVEGARPLNATTLMLGGDPLLGSRTSSQLPIDARKEFILRYPIIKPHLEHHRELGLLALAFDKEDDAVGSAWVRASLDRTSAIVIGRHSECHLALPQSCEESPLRHLVVLARAIAFDEVRLRVIDLATNVGFKDERGALYEGLVAEGPVFLQVGRVVLMLLVTGGALSVPEEAEQAFAEIPDRVFLKDRPGVSARRPSGPPHVPHEGRRVTKVTWSPGPVPVTKAFGHSDDVRAGFLELRSDSEHVRKAVGASVLDRGLLIGRYDRCDVGLSEDYSKISRVHLLVIRHDDQVLAIDTASTAGTFVGQAKAGVIDLGQEG